MRNEKILLALGAVEGNVLDARPPSFSHLVKVHELIYLRGELVLCALAQKLTDTLRCDGEIMGIPP